MLVVSDQNTFGPGVQFDDMGRLVRIRIGFEMATNVLDWHRLAGSRRWTVPAPQLVL